MSAVEGLERPCHVCGRVCGEHSLYEWADCVGTTTLDLPYENTPTDIADAYSALIRERFNLDEDLIVADHVVVTAVTLDAAAGNVKVRLPALFHEFQVGIAGGTATVAKVAFLATTDAMRAYGRLTRDSANGAANAAEKGTR